MCFLSELPSSRGVEGGGTNPALASAWQRRPPLLCAIKARDNSTNTDTCSGSFPPCSDSSNKGRDHHPLSQPQKQSLTPLPPRPVKPCAGGPAGEEGIVMGDADDDREAEEGWRGDAGLREGGVKEGDLIHTCTLPRIHAAIILFPGSSTGASTGTPRDSLLIHPRPSHPPQ